MQSSWSVYGDNILECWRLALYASSGNKIGPSISICDVSNPSVMWRDGESVVEAKLIPSPDRIPAEIRKALGSEENSLREQPDVVLCKENELISTYEFCSALPAGNNAWQRHGRSLSLCINGVLHFHIAKIGGYELDANRAKKAPRLPNPLVLISYLRMSSGIFPGRSYFVPLLHDDCPPDLEVKLRQFDCKKEISTIISRQIRGASYSEYLENMTAKTIAIIANTTIDLRKDSTLSTGEWLSLAQAACDSSKSITAAVQSMRKVKWSKHAPTNKSQTGRVLQRYLEANFHSLGSSTIPICMASDAEVEKFIDFLASAYEVDRQILDQVFGDCSTLLVTCDSGFKPRGDDSRPARGLTPFAKSFIYGDPHSKLLVFLYGPCKQEQWKMIRDGNLATLASTNGLWESIYAMADFLVLDCESHPHPLLVSTKES